MNKHFTWAAVLSLIITCFGAIACSDDNNTDSDNSEKDSLIRVSYDELGILQSALVTTDSTGVFERRVLGVPLDNADTTCVSVGVDSYQEAKELFVGLFSPVTVWNEDSTIATFSDGKGSARLTRDGDAAGLVAKAEFSVPGLKYVSSVNFILNSAWPANAVREGDYILGETYKFTTWQRVRTWISGGVGGQGAFYTALIPGYKDDNGKEHGNQDISTFENVLSEYVCIRPYKNGKPALLVQISHYEHKGPSGDMCMQYRVIPSVEKAKEISAVLRSNWSYFDAAFTLENGKHLLNSGASYWTSTEENKDWPNARHYDICLSNGKTDYWYYLRIGSKWRRVIFYKEMQ